MNHSLLLVAALAAPTLSEPSPDIVAGRAYAGCIGYNAVLLSASVPRIDDAVAGAFAACAAERKTARDAMVATLRSHGLSDADAAAEVDQMISENEQMMSEQLKTDIATFRRTGRPPTDAHD